MKDMVIKQIEELPRIRDENIKLVYTSPDLKGSSRGRLATNTLKKLLDKEIGLRYDVDRNQHHHFYFFASPDAAAVVFSTQGVGYAEAFRLEVTEFKPDYAERIISEAMRIVTKVRKISDEKARLMDYLPGY